MHYCHKNYEPFQLHPERDTPDQHCIMSDNVGLSTPRGSGTSGYVQRNLAHIKPRDHAAPYPKDLDSLRHRQRQPDKGILEHDRKREVEVKVFELRDKLEEEEYVECPSSCALVHETNMFSGLMRMRLKSDATHCGRSY